MKQLLRFLDNSDPCSLLLTAIILAVLGRSMAGMRTRVVAWGQRIAAIVFIASLIFDAIRFRPGVAEELLPLIVQAMIRAFAALAIAWILLTVLAFVHENAIGPSIGRFRTSFSKLGRSARARAEERRRRLEDQRAEEEKSRQQPRLEEEQRRQASAHRRREDARLACEELYNLLAHDLGERFTREMFNDYVNKYLGDDRDPEYVEERGRQFQIYLKKQLKRVDPKPAKPSIEQLAKSLEAKKKSIETLPIDPDAKEILLIELEEHLEEQLRRQIKED